MSTTTTIPSHLIETVTSAAGSGLDAASHLVADATESLGDIAGAAIDVGGSAAGVVADSTVRGARKIWSVAPNAIRRHPVLVASGAAVLVACFVLARRRAGNETSDQESDRPAPRGVTAVDAA
ncbi:MAG: hypothetical protein ACRDZZ_01605 [Ilumatobacteraceae bacterium]